MLEYVIWRGLGLCDGGVAEGNGVGDFDHVCGRRNVSLGHIHAPTVFAAKVPGLSDIQLMVYNDP